MDYNNPDKFLNTAYDALKGNPNATNQIIQAAAKGQPVGLRGLAAAAAQQSQQQAQQAQQQAQQQRGPQPTVMQKLAMQAQQQQGIMGQLPSNVQLASAPQGAPQQPQQPPQMAPQGMAGGGLVAFADGGSVLPPDVIDAIQSHFAQGGAVRGFAEGDYLSSEDVRAKYEQMQKEIQDLLERKHLESKYRGLKGMSPEEMAKEAARHAERVKMGRLSESSGFEPSAAEPEPKGPRYGDLYPQSSGPGAPSMYERATYKDLYPSAERAPEYTPYRPPEGPGPSMMEKLAAHSAEPAVRLDPNMAKLARAAGQDLPEIPKAADAWTGGEGFSGMGKLGAFGKGLGRLVSNPALALLSPEVLGAANLYTGAAKKAVGMDGLQDIVSGANQMFDVGLPEEDRMGQLKSAFGRAGEINPAISREEWGKRKASNKDAEIKQEGTYVPDPADVAPNQPEITPKSEVHKEGQKVSEEFRTVKQPTPSVATTPGADTASLTSGESYGAPDSMGLGGLEQARDLVSQLRGQQRMDPEIAAKLADMESGARNSTIMQSLMGALGGGLSSPYGGRFAMGKAALGALAGYQHGASSEDDMQRKAFDVYKQYADMPISEQQKAADFILKTEQDKAAQQSAERIADLKGDTRLDIERLKEQYRLEHPELHGAGGAYGIMDPAKLATMQNLAEDNAQKRIEAESKKRASNAEPPLTEEEKQKLRMQAYAEQNAYIQSRGMPGFGGFAAPGQLGSGSPALTVTRSGVVR